MSNSGRILQVRPSGYLQDERGYYYPFKVILRSAFSSEFGEESALKAIQTLSRVFSREVYELITSKFYVAKPRLLDSRKVHFSAQRILAHQIQLVE